MYCIVSATGQAIPSVFVFPRVNYRDLMMTGAPEGSLGLVNPSGWMTSENFIRVIDHSVAHVRPTKDHPVILTMDNHESHISYTALEKSKANNIIIITLPTHTSNKTQPLDRTVFGPLKAAFNQNADAWMLQNPGKTISMYQLAQLGGSAFVRAATPSNITAGFRVSDMRPLDRNAFDSNEFLPSAVTDRPRPEHTEEIADHPADETVAIPGSSSGTQEPEQESTSETAPAQSMPTSAFQKSPVDLRGYPKTPARKEAARGRKRGKSMVATSTPEMKCIWEENEKKKLKRSKAGPSKKLFLEQDDDSASDISISELVDESQDECEESASGNVLQLGVVENAVKGDYVIVEFAKKKHMLLRWSSSERQRW
ncbi:tigger transposable element-derived protein [Plakobranchus ocellatus]|uniref:Tigger transposable element-derived protein n=1 Tax=Plakobranchus ocellatus TaxID=259542 RepID=A0AAV4DA72_9GAST|nr:tigger transposable element-derived protein [Plakobranchus ocellatus]